MNRMIVALAALALSAPALSAPLLAQAPAPAAPAAGSAPAAGAVATPAAGAGTFANAASNANLSEIEASRLALARSRNPAVRVFARWIIADHDIANQWIAGIAREHKIELASALDPEHQKRLEKLQGLSEAAFDRQYVADQIAAQEQTIALFQKESDATGDAPFKTVASRLLPSLRAHLQAARELQSSLPSS